MKLSVIVATRNRAHAIAESLHSIAASLAKATPLDAEIVVVDNGSRDATSEIVKQWAAGCPFPVRLVLNGFSDERMMRRKFTRRVGIYRIASE